MCTVLYLFFFVDKNLIKKMAIDPMFKLEHGSDDTVKGQKAKANLSIIESMRQDKKDDYLLNKLARHKFRVGCKMKVKYKRQTVIHEEYVLL